MPFQSNKRTFPIKFYTYPRTFPIFTNFCTLTSQCAAFAVLAIKEGVPENFADMKCACT